MPVNAYVRTPGHPSRFGAFQLKLQHHTAAYHATDVHRFLQVWIFATALEHVILPTQWLLSALMWSST
jgi:hypothetical protein